MDANGLQFWMLAEENHFQLPGEPAQLNYDRDKRCLRLARQRRQLSFSSSEVLARENLELVPRCEDSYHTIAYWDSIREALMATGALQGAVEIYSPPLLPDDSDFSNIPSDVLMGTDGVLYIAINDTVLMQDRRERWDDQQLNRENFIPWRMAASAAGGVWVLDRDNGKLGRVTGLPLPKRLGGGTRNEQAQACAKNDDPPRILELSESFFGSDEEPVAIAANAQDLVAVLSWLSDGTALLRLITLRSDSSLAVSDAITLSGVIFPYSLAFHENDKLAVLIAGDNTEVPVYSIATVGKSWWPVGDLYPLAKNAVVGPFMHTPSIIAHYSVITDDEQIASKALRKLSFPFYAKQGFAFNNSELLLLDGQKPGMTWHRLFIEASIPRGCGVRIWLAATDDYAEPQDLCSHQWFEHRFGEIYRADNDFDGPVACWEPVASEIPHHSGFLPCDIEAQFCGLFSALIQRRGKKSRALKGRYLHVNIELTGTGRSTPEIYALRAYGSRFSYVHQYLPPFYHETISEPDASENGTATPADFMERFVANFEGVLTRLEDRIAAAHRLTLPESAPAQSLPWLASWVATPLEQALSENQQRKLLRYSHLMNRWRGTLRGLKLALELATDDGISGGEIVVLEDFRMRRTFATIVGADLDDDDDPLTLGGRVSGNSYVGDTLFIGDENKKEFLALFSADLDISGDEAQAITNLFDRLAHRVTVLVHQEIEPQNMDLIREVVAREAPAHVVVRVLSASRPFLVGMAALVGVDTYLAKKLGPSKARIDHSQLTRNAYLTGPAALDPRFEGMGSGIPTDVERAPVAVANNVTASFGETVVLDASASRAWQGRRITEYHWSINEE
ncbi:phage tail-like protein [Alteromonadaceae bacterium 2753L.S.0a.02]|nr:phage tail-like protein [Alteromonadaceae bacterium 2753L.S.0a.02]